MRAISLSVGLLAGALILPMPAPAMAQTGGAPPVGTLTPQGVPPGTSAETGARPGNDVGTGMSMPLGNRASNIDSRDTHSSIAPNLSGPALGDSAGPADYLRSAQGSLAAGRTGEAQQALEMAQTRMLDRSVPYGQTNNPSDNPAVGQISQALRALASGDRAQCMALIQAAIPLAR